MKPKRIPKACARTCCDTPIGNPHAPECRHAYVEMESKWATIKAEFVTVTWTVMMQDPFRCRFAYVKPSGVGTYGELIAVLDDTDPPAGFELVTPERIPVNDKATIARWLERFAGRLPVFPQ